MKIHKGSTLIRSATLICGLMLARVISAQSFTTLHSFTGGNDGGWPYGGLTLTSNTLYGTSYFKQVSPTLGSVEGTVFVVSTDGMGFTNLHSFSPIDLIAETNREGNGPMATLTL